MTALEVEMARLAQWLESPARTLAGWGFDLQCGGEGWSGHVYTRPEHGLTRFHEATADRPEDALCELLDKVEGRS